MLPLDFRFLKGRSWLSRSALSRLWPIAPMHRFSPPFLIVVPAKLGDEPATPDSASRSKATGANFKRQKSPRFPVRGMHGVY